MSPRTRYARLTWAAALWLAGSVGTAQATEGYFQHGYGARQKALAGAGVADSRDATAVALNPAGLVHVENQYNFAVSVFSPRREYTGAAFPAANPGFAPQGSIESQWNYFYIPNMARSWRVDNGLVDVVAISMYGNGGMNTHWGDVQRNSSPFECTNPGGAVGTRTGIFCAGLLGVNLNQAFLSVAAAKKFGKVSVGIAPILAMQQIEIHGLGAFAGISSDPNNLTNRGLVTSWGYGVRGGIEVALRPNVRVGVSGNSRVYMEEFDKYKGLFAEQGDFDIPASLQAGIAIDLRPDLTAMFDYRRIWYSDIAAISNDSQNASLAGAGNTAFNLGNDLGAGFGWRDIEIYKFGLEWRANDQWTWRAGYAHGENPVRPDDVMFNILAPGIVEDEYTAGAKYKWSDTLELELAGMYAPEVTLAGFELATVANPTHAIEVSMYQWEVTAGFTWKFGAEATSFK